MLTWKSSFVKRIGQFDDIDYASNFKPIPVTEELPELPEDIVKSLSTDQKICYKLVKAVMKGSLPINLQDLKCGPLSHAR